VDPVRLLNRGPSGYVSDPNYAMHSPDTAADSVVPPEPEAIPEGIQAQFSAQARQTREVVKAEQLAIQRRDSRLGKLKQLENEARRRNKDATRFTAQIDRTLSDWHRWLGSA
jgi:hypothetical protein